jgi:hypothetical protein
VKVLDQLSPDVLDVLNFERNALTRLHAKLRILNITAEETEVRGERKVPEKVQPHEIAKTVALHYCRLTGKKKPTLSKSWDRKVGGAFFKLLKTVYDVLDVKASAESQADKIIKEWMR